MFIHDVLCTIARFVSARRASWCVEHTGGIAKERVMCFCVGV